MEGSSGHEKAEEGQGSGSGGSLDAVQGSSLAAAAKDAGQCAEPSCRQAGGPMDSERAGSNALRSRLEGASNAGAPLAPL